MSKIDRVYIDKNDVSLYKELDRDDFLSQGNDSLKKLENKEKFLLAVSIGFKNKVRRPLDKREGYTLLNYFKAKDISLIQSVALYEKDDPEILKDEEKVFRIAEEYAHAGIKILVDKIKTPGFSDFWKVFEKELYESYMLIERED